ncbi:MAG: amino acid adenylation domain-containing protein [Gammaproteobacteria bacterium]|nr:amino acid adenylation domain-containing protein [Gammaproteobacteria bacterium]
MNILDTIHQRIEAQATRTPEGIAVLCSGQFMTYEDLNQKANQLAHYLQKMGVKPDVLVALCMARSIDLIIAILGVLKAGGAYVPLDSSHPEERLLDTLQDSNARVIITKSVFKDKFINFKGALIVLDNVESEINTQSTQNLDSVATAQNLAYVIYTSGSKGKPKGVLIEHQSVVNYSLWFSDYCNCQSQQRMDFSSNYVFDMTVSTTVVPLMLGLTIVICHEEDKLNSRHYLQYLNEHKVNIIKITPSYFSLLLHEIKNDRIDLPHLQTIFLGGENLPVIQCASWLAMYPEHHLYNEYGPTEATVAVSQYKITPSNCAALDVFVPIGKPGLNMDCYICSPDNQLVPDGEIGELYIGGVCLARGYLNQAELTKKQFIQDPFSKDAQARLYKTGDVCRRQPDGTLECLGRIDEQIKLRGFRIEPGEIERHLAAYPAMDEVAVLVREDEQHEQRLIAYYTLKDVDIALNDHELHHFLEAHVPDYMIPTAFVRLKTYPLTANGKLDKSALPMPQFTHHPHDKELSTALERTLASIWSEELGIKSIGVDDHFYELGGHSLSAARIVSTINNVLNKDISLNDFYHALTIKALIPIVNAASEKKRPSTQALNDSALLLPLSHFQFLIWISTLFEPQVKKLNVVTRKRVQGHLDIIALQAAFKAVLKKHECLSYRVLKFRPAQKVQHDLPFKIIEKNIESLSDKESEVVLEASLNELFYYYPWDNHAPLLLVRLFYMLDDITELQFCMPHIISDEVSLDILQSELSMFYLLYHRQSKIEPVNADACYRDYLGDEASYSQAYLDRDMMFWKTYLKDACLFTFPPETIVEDMASQGFSYSTYVEIPEQALNHLQQCCVKNHVTINDGLCAALALALLNCCGDFHDESKPIVMNRVKSTREQVSYDQTMGCFLRIDPIKVEINKKSTIITLSKQIHQSGMDTLLYQSCASVVKLACLNDLHQKTTFVRRCLVKLLIYIYTKIVRTPILNPNLLNLCAQLSPLGKSHKFLININAQNNFIAGNKLKERSFLGFKIKKLELVPYDVLKINSFFDVCFIRSDSQNIPYVVISAILKPDFRERIAKEMIRILNEKAIKKRKI